MAHEYRNVLTKIERDRRAALREAMSGATALVAQREAEEKSAAEALDVALATVKRARGKARARVETAEMTAAVKAGREMHKLAKAALRQARQDARQSPELIAANDAINDRAHERRLEARHNSKLRHCTYLLIEAEDDASRKMPLYDGAAPNDPRFSRWDGEGRVSVQVQGGMSLDELFGEDTFVRVDKPDERAWYAESRGERCRLCHTTLSLRVSSNEDRSPVWGRWEMLMHRPIPDGARIKVVTVSLRRIGRREKWDVCFTLDLTESRRPETAPVERVTAIDLGWRLDPEGDKTGEIRVCAWADDQGGVGELRLPPGLIAQIRKVEDLRSIRDKAFNAARAALVGWLATTTGWPEWLTKDTATIAQWRSPNRFMRLLQYWEYHRFPGDETAPVQWMPGTVFSGTRYHDEHLWQWECDQRRKALAHRREVYRMFAAQVARRSAVVVLEAFDLRKPGFAMRALPEAGAENEAARSNRHLVAVAELRLALVNAANGLGRNVDIEPAQDTTRACNVCGVVNHWDQATEVRHVCEACSAEWDQDDNAAQNLLARRRERLGALKKAGPARKGDKPTESQEKKEGRWERARRLLAEKEARRGTAREPHAKVSE